MILKGNAITIGKNIDTDQIIPAKYLNLTDSKELGKHCLEGYSNNFPELLNEETIIFAEENFGCGSSREHAPFAIKGAGVKAIVAKSFARIFFRNAINLGLTVIECPEAVDKVEKDDKIKIDMDNGKIYNNNKKQQFKFSSYPKIIKEILMSDGITGYYKNYNL